MAKKNPIEDIRIDIENRYNMAIADMASQVTEQIEAAYETVIQSFYDDYTPRWYDRTYSTYEASDHADDIFKTTPIDNGFEAGIKIDPSFINGKPYRADTAWVFDRTFGKGIHGYFKWEMKQWAPQTWKNMNRKYLMSKARKERLADFLKKSIKHSPRKYKPKLTAMVYAVGEQKSVQAVQLHQIRSTTPHKSMDAAFRQITSKKNMDAMFSTILSSYFSK